MSLENHEREFEDFKSAIARLHHASGLVVGAGFLVSDRNLLTCAHVVTAALGIPQNTQAMPLGFVELDFPQIAPGQKIKSQVVFWQPINPSQIGEDLAILLLEDDFPHGVKPLHLMNCGNFWDHQVRILGFPKDHGAGIWATGTLRDKLAQGWVQFDGISSQDRTIEKGFSGAPVWDETVKGVVGMAIAAEKRREDVTAAFMIPTSILSSIWSKLIPVKPSGASRLDPQDIPKSELQHPNNNILKIPVAPLKANYDRLRNFLEMKAWQEADLETIQVILQVAKKQKEGWLKAKDIDNFPCADLCTIDRLWLEASGGQFGFSVQRKIWLDVNGQLGKFDSETFRNFGDCVGWRVNDNWIRHYKELSFSLDTPEGHFPSLRFPRAEDGMNWFETWKSNFKGFLTHMESCL